MKLLAAALLGAAFAAPAVAQDMPSFTEAEVADATAAIEALALDETTYQQLWCGAAFLVFTNYLKGQGDTAGADAATAMGNTLFAKVETTLLPQALERAELELIGRNASIIAISQLNPETTAQPAFTQEQCTAAAQAQ